MVNGKVPNFDLTFTPSRRHVLLAAAATATLPVLGAALHSLRPAAAQTTPAGNWVATTTKAADLKDNEFTPTSIPGVLLVRTGNTVAALSNKCTHKGCSMTPKSASKTLTCQCHNAQFNLDGSVARAPANQPLPHFAIRLNDKGFLEVDTSQTLGKTDKSAAAVIS